MPGLVSINLRPILLAPTRFGHLYIKAEIEMPKKLTQQQRELAQQMFAGDKPPKEEL